MMEVDPDLKDDDEQEDKPGFPLPRELMYREMGMGFGGGRGRTIIGSKVVSDNFAGTADYNLVACNKKLNCKSKFKVPSDARTTFHMAFSGCGKLVASCHGDHNVYICEIKSGKVVKTLSGHPRTPWCVVFHPTQSDIIASGCLAGHVRVWDLNGGSELLVTDSGTVIASLAFHPTVRLLAIGTFNEVLFWDWSKGDVPLARCCTENNKEKVRLVRFDSSGRSLITGITNFPTAPQQMQGVQVPPVQRPTINILRNLGEMDLDPELQEELEERQDRFQESYRQLVNHYEDLVQHYHSFLRSRIPRILGNNNTADGRGDDDSFGDPRPGPSSGNSRVGIIGGHFLLPPSFRGNSAFQGLGASSSGFSGSIPSTPASPGASNTTSQTSNPSTSSESQAAISSSSASAASSREFSSIEALAQNIMEMQNLCSQARQRVRLGPQPTMETQHVMELQQIRQHLEVLQDQTRRLQHSIRATLTSLATGSLAALRSQEGNNNNTGATNTTNTTSTSSANGSSVNLNTSTLPTPSSSNQSPITSAGPTSTPHSHPHPHPLFPNPNVVPQQIGGSEERPRRSISPSTSSSTSFFRISINSSPDRMRVPPVVRYNDNRRVVTREFVIDHHSRSCPFNLNQQPPPVSNRTRCLIEEDGQVELEAWPTMETGMDSRTRSFPGVIVPLRREEAIASTSSPHSDVNLRVFLTMRAGAAAQTDDVEMTENWQRNFLSGLALVPSAVREGRRGRNIRIRRNYLRSQVPTRLNSSFVRSFYIRVDNNELVPVYSSSHETTSSHEIRDGVGSNVFVFPISVFFHEFDSSQIGIYWPCINQSEEEALSDVRRYEQPITVYPNQNANGRRVRISYDSNSLDIEVGGVRLGFVQPGIVLETVTNLRGVGARGVVFVDYLAPFLEGMERYFSQQFMGNGGRGRSRRNPRRIITFARDNNNAASFASSFEYRSGGGSARVSQFHDIPSDDDNRRVLSLAVEAAAASTASELLINRRPVESRIERVLNNSTALNSLGSGDGLSLSSSSSGISTSSGSTSSIMSVERQERMDQEEIQRRINFLANNRPPFPPRTGRTTQTQTNPGLNPNFPPSAPLRTSTPISDEGLIINRSQVVPSSPHHWVIRRQRRFTNQPVQRTAVDSNVGTSARTRANPQGNGGRNNDSRNQQIEAEVETESSRLFQYNPEILITPRATLNGAGMFQHQSNIPGPIAPPPTSAYYQLDSSTSAFLSSRVQKWDFSQFIIPDISQRTRNIVVSECSLHSDACLDISKNSDFLAVLQPSDSGAYSSLGVYSLKAASLGDLLYVYHFDQNTVSVSISPSSEYIVVGYAGRGQIYRFAQQGSNAGRNIGQVLSLKGKNGTLLSVRDLYVENTGHIMAINCMHFLPVPGMGLVYGTNTGELVMLQ